MTRIQRLRNALDTERGLLIETAVSRQYLTEFASSDGLLLITPTRAVLAMDSRYLEAASAAVTDAEVVPYDKAFFDLVKECKEILCEFTLSYAQVAALAKQTAPAELIPSRELSDAVSQMRAVKDAKELARIEAAQALTDAAFVHIQDHLRVGVTERQIALELEFFMRKNGAQSVAFDTIALTGAHGSMPHGVPDDRPIQNGDLVTMDFGARLDGYCSDMTRTVAVGIPDAQALEIYDVVLAAQTAALSVIRAGVDCKAVDEVARAVIRDAGYGDYFGHATGHGVGLEVHEAPNLSPRSTAVLQEGNVVTVEPGIYLPQKMGVRIEDFVFVTRNGCKNLTHSQKEVKKA